MLFSVARLRRVSAFLLFAHYVDAKVESLFTSSVSYCAPPESLFIQQFDVAYIAQNSSVSFNVSVASVESNINVTANLFLNVYGMHPFNITIDLCSILSGALCPLPTYNFTGSDSIPLPSSLDIASKIPGIAYKIPDLEAFAQLTLIEVDTGNVTACVQSTLSNGWTTHQTAVEWTTGGLTLLALISAIWRSLSPDALAPYRLLDLLYLYQSIAITGFLKLNYPSVYRAFTLNFAWSMGLFFTSHTSTLQNAINRMRHHTGGDMADASGGSVVELVNRKLSPYNVPPPGRDFAIPGGLSGATNLPQVNLASLTGLTSVKSAPTLLDGITGVGDVATVTTSNVLEAGVPIYVNSIHIATANAFMTVFTSALMLAAISLAVFGLGYAILHALDCFGCGKGQRWARLKYAYPSFVKAWGLRLCLIIFTPITVFTLYQWSLKDSWLSTLLSVIVFLFICGCILYPTFLTLRLALPSTPYALSTHTEYLTSCGPLFGQYRTARSYFFFCLLVSSFSKALFITSVKEHGQAQVILMFLVELGIFLAHVILQPYKSKGGDILATFVAVVRLVATGLLVAFVESLALAAIPRVVIGIIISVLFSITVLVMLLNNLLHGVGGLWSSLSSQRTPFHQQSADESMLEKGSPVPLSRPLNPVPECNVDLDSEINRHSLMPATPTQSSFNTGLQPSEYSHSRDSASTTNGSILPRQLSLSCAPQWPPNIIWTNFTTPGHSRPSTLAEHT